MKKIISAICALAMIASMACLAVPAADPALTFAVEAGNVAAGATTVTADFVITLPDNATGYELGGFVVDIVYDKDVMTLTEVPKLAVKGTAATSENAKACPFRIAWANLKPIFVAGRNVVVTLNFKLAKPAEDGDTYNISVAVADDNLPYAMPSKDGEYPDYQYTAEQVTLVPATITVGGTVSGDINSDGDVNLADVTLLLKHLASWDVSVNTSAADVNADSDVNLADATLLLKYLAGWSVVLK